jgi:predicted AAA+ superfamily ATPase
MAVNYIYRQVTDRLTRLTEAFPVVVITGARQVGKTTLLRHVFGESGDYAFIVPWNVCPR